ncbi:MAG: hypothetical protein NEA02_13655 [Thermoanaerobaculia bacterium]|nr:hypothetical protein [Thermoanaerobaculia bacterium]
MHMNTEKTRYGAAGAAAAFSLFLVCVLPAAPAHAAQEIWLGSESDHCGGVLHLKNRNNQWIKIERGNVTNVDVAIDGNGYWYWRCGSSNEKSRGTPNYRNRVKRLRVLHSENSRDIVFDCYDLLK